MNRIAGEKNVPKGGRLHANATGQQLTAIGFRSHCAHKSVILTPFGSGFKERDKVTKLLYFSYCCKLLVLRAREIFERLKTLTPYRQTHCRMVML
jgi:hypothetical protein